MTETAILDPNRDTCQALYLQGFGHAQISEKTGVKQQTIRTWIYRYGWNTLRDKVSTHLEQRITTPLLAKTVVSASAKVREQFANSLAVAGDLLSQKKPKGLKQALAIQEALEPAVRNANKVFGWDQQSASTIASVQSLSSELPEQAKLRSHTEEMPVLPQYNTASRQAIDAQASAIESVSKELPK